MAGSPRWQDEPSRHSTYRSQPCPIDFPCRTPAANIPSSLFRSSCNPPARVGFQDGPVPDHGETSYTGSGKLKGRKALVTGGDSGIGRATAIAFAREDADVAIAYLEAEAADAKEVLRLIEAEGRTALGCPATSPTRHGAETSSPRQSRSWAGSTSSSSMRGANRIAKTSPIGDSQPGQR